jgi:hypothetical protein
LRGSKRCSEPSEFVDLILTRRDSVGGSSERRKSRFLVLAAEFQFLTGIIEKLVTTVWVLIDGSVQRRLLSLVVGRLSKATSK